MLEEEASPAVPVTFELTLPPLRQQITLAVSVENATAQLNADYTLAVWGGSYSMSSGVLTIPAMTESVTFAISAVDDQVVDSGKAVTFTLSARDGVNALPPGVWLGDDTAHKVTIVDGESKVGITQARRHGILNEPSAGQNWRFTVPVGALDPNIANDATDDQRATAHAVSAALLAAAMTEDAILQVSHYGAGFTGDQEINPQWQSNPVNPDGSDDYVIGTLTIDKDTGMGSFDIIVNEDAFPEGREWLFLRISDPNGNLPAGWTVDPKHSDYRLIIYGNDNGMRFAEWPRNNPGEFAQISATVGEGSGTNMVVLVSHLAPDGDIAALIDVPEQYKDDIKITNLDNNRSHYDQASGRFLMRRLQHGWGWYDRGDRTGAWREGAPAPNFAGALKIEVLSDDVSEDEEVIEITLRDEANPSAAVRAWGSVENVSDTGSPRVSTSTVFTLTIPGENENIFFASPASSVVDGGSTTLDVLITPQLAEAASVSLTSSSSDVYIMSEHYDAASDVLTLPASTDKVTLTLTTTKDTDGIDDTVTLTLAEHMGNPLPNSHDIGVHSRHSLEILETRIIGFGGGEPTEDIRGRGIWDATGEVITIGFEPSFVHARLNETGTTSTMVDVVSNAHSSLVQELDGIVLDVVASVTGDLAVNLNHRNNPVNPDGTADFTIGTLTLDATGQGSFSFTVIDDSFVEDREVVTLVLAERETNPLPSGWTLLEEEYYILIEANDHAARFAEWPRNNPGGFASLAPTVREGDETGLLILLTGHAPSNPAPIRGHPRGNLPFTVEVESGHEDDIEIYRLSGRDDMQSTDILDDGTLLVTSRTTYLVQYVSGTHYIPADTIAPIVGAGFGIRALNDGINEDEEVITLTLREGNGFSTEWGSVRNAADVRMPAVKTSTTITLTIPANDDGAVGFASTGPAGSTTPIEEEGIVSVREGSRIILNIAPVGAQSAAAFGTLNLQSDIELTLEMSADGADNDGDGGYTAPGTVTLDKDTGQGSFVFTVHEDEVAEVEKNVTLTLTDSGGVFPTGWDIEPLTVTVSIGDNDNAARFAEWPRGSGNYAQLAGTIVEGDSDSVANMIVLLTTPAPVDGLPVEIAVESGYENDIVFKNVDENRSTWDDTTNIFTVKSSFADAALQISAVFDGEMEGPEEIDITMRRPDSGFPVFWGAVANVTDAGTPTSLTYVLTVEDSLGSINFSTTESMLEEDAIPASPVTFKLTLPPLEQQITLAVSIENTTAQPVTDYTFHVEVEGGSYESGNTANILTIPAMTESVTFTVNAVKDEIADSGKTVTFALSGRDGADALPPGLLIGDDNAHTVTIIDDDSKIGITQAGRVGILNEPGTGKDWRLDVPVGALGSGNAPTLAGSMSKDAILQVSQYGAGFSGDQEVHEDHRNSPHNPDNSEDYTVGTLTIDKDTGTGNFNITINGDTFPEGREWLFLRISDPNGNLPAGWTVDPDHSDYRLIINGNDNGMRFAEWPRDNPGGTAQLSAAVGEGGETNVVVLLSHLAPDGDVAALIDVPDAHKDDIRITNVDDDETSYDSGNGRFVIKRRQQDWDASSIGREDQTGSWTEPVVPPNIAGTLKIEVLSDDDEEEDEEVIEITLRDETSPSSTTRAWGRVRDIPDAGSPRVSTSTVFTLTIPGEDDNISFGSPDSSVIEGGSTTLDVLITPQLAEAASISLTSSGGDVSITSNHYNAANDVLTLPASTDKVTLTLATTKDTDAIDDTVTLTLVQRAGTALPDGHEIGRSEHTLNILETRMIGFGGGEPTQDIRGRGRVGNADIEFGFEPHFVHVRLNETGTTSTMVDVVSDGHNSLVQELDGVVLDVVASVTGDPAVHPNHRNNPVNLDGTADFTIGTLTLDAAGRGSFRFTVNGDSLIEGREVVTLALAENDASPAPLPSGWTLSEENYYIVIEANDNSASFAEWPRNNPGGFASLEPTLEEGEETGFLILLTGHAPVTTTGGALPFTVEVGSGYKDDVEIYRLSDSKDMLSTDIAGDGTLLVSSRPSPTLSLVSESDYVPGNSAPVIAGRFGLRVVNDGKFEDEEVVTLTLREGPGFPKAWGAVRDIADTGIPAVETSTTITLTIPTHVATIGFTETASTGAEGIADSSMIEIALSASAPAGGLNLRLTLDNTTGSPSYRVATADASKATYMEDSELLTINEGQTTVTLIGSQNNDNDNLNNRYVFTLAGHNNSLPEGWVIDADKGTHTVTFADMTPLTSTIGWERTEVVAREDDGLVIVNLKLTDRAGSDVPFTSAIPALNFTAGASDAADFLIDIAGAGSWTAGTGSVALTAGRSYEDGFISVRFNIIDDVFVEGTQSHNFTITANNFPSNWEVDDTNKTLVLTITDDDTTPEGGNTVEFATVSGNINELGLQAISTKVVIDRPNKIEMKFLLQPLSPNEGAVASGADYGLTVKSPAVFDAGTGIVTVPAGTREFEIDVAAKEDSHDDDFEAVVFTLGENENATLPDGWRIGEENTFTVTIFDNDGTTRPAATLSQWPRGGSNAGELAQSSSTTEEGRTAKGAVYLTEAGPVPGGIPLVLTVEAGHEDDVTITDYGDERSAVSEGAVAGTYNFLMAGGRFEGAQNLAALFNINVVNDNLNEPVEVIDISISKGEGFPDNWTLRDDVVYRLTVPRDASDTGGTIGFAASNRSLFIEGRSNILRTIEASAPAPRGGLTVGWSAALAADADASNTISKTSGSVTISEGRRRASFTLNSIDNNAVTGAIAVIFSLTGNNLPSGWSTSSIKQTLNITDDDLLRTIGGNTVEFAHAAANINEEDTQSVATKVLINHPHRAEMKLLLTAGAPANGSRASTDDYTFIVRSPASYDSDSNILTIPAETTEFEVEVTAVADTDDDDFEAVALTLKESADADTGAQLPEGWSVGERSVFTVTIFDDDGSTRRPTATLSQWFRAGANKGRYAQLSSTTVEGGTAPAAVVLTESSPDPDGLNFVLKVEDGHEDDVTLVDAGDWRSTLVPGRVRGEYLFHMTGSNSNLAAIFDINVVDDDENEPIEVVDISISKGANFPNNWMVREDVSYRLTIPRDTGDSGGTLGFAGSASTVVEGQSGVVRVVEASAPVPTNLTLNWNATVATEPPSDAPPALGDVISETSGTLIIYKGYRRTEFSFDATDNETAGLVDPVVTFTLMTDSLPEGWTIARPTHVMTIRDDDATRSGGNLVFFEGAAANINENGLQKVSTRVIIDRPDNAEMRFLLARGGPATGVAAGDDDYTFSVKSPAMYDAATNIVTVPPGTDGFDLEVTARDDAVDDDSEAVVFTIREDNDIAMLPEGWEIDGERASFSVTIVDDDGAGQRPSATLSQWLREGGDVGRFAQLSSTTAEGGTVQGAVYLTQAGPYPEGLHFLLTVEDGHALDVTLTDYGDNRSTLVASETTAGLYHLHVTGGNFGIGRGVPNVAALFNIHVQEDVQREAEEVVDITLSAGENFPDDWIVHGDAVYRLTIPSEDSNVRFRTPTSTAKEDSSEHSVRVEVRPPASEDLTFTIAHAGTVGPDTASDDDYSLQSDTLTIKAGESSGNFKVSITNDSEVENDETIVFELSGEVPTGYTIGRSRHTLTIEDNDKNTVGFDTTSASVEEGEKINLRIKLKDSTDAAITLLDNNLPLSIVVDGNDDHDVEFAGGFTLLTPSITLTDGVFEMAIPVLAVADEVIENAETVTFTLNEAANFPDNYVIDSSVDTFTLTINANGQATSSGMIQFAQTEMLFREPYPGESTGVSQGIRNVIADDCANTEALNCVVYYFDLDVTGVPDQAFDITIEKYSLLRGNFDLKTLGLDGLSASEWGYPMRHRVTPEDARDGKTRVPIAIARDSEFEPTEYWGLELSTNGLPSGWSLGQQEDVLVGVQDSTGGQVWFAPNDADNGVETFNHSIINEGETVKVRIAANQVGTNDTPLSVSIEGHSGQSHPDIIGTPYNVTLERNTAWVDMEIAAVNDDIGEGDESYTLVVNQGPGWQDYHGRRIDPARSRYTFTIPANDGLAEGVAQFSEWTRSGAHQGLFAQLSSTVAEGGVVQGAVVLNAPAPEPDGLNFILKVEPRHEGDVFLTNIEPSRSSLAAGDIPGEYKFNIKSGRVNSADNLAALFNIHVVDDALVEESEEIEISLLPGPGVPYYWTVRGETPYRLTVPADTNDTDNHTIAWETQTSVLIEDNMEVADGISVKLLIDDPLASNAVVGVDFPDTIAVADVANGAYDADARALTINANADEVTLTIVSTGDISGHALAVLKVAEFAGTRALPAGWSVSEGFHVVTIEDNERTLRFSRSEVQVEEGENATIELQVSPPLISTNVSVPLLLTGDADAYRLLNVSSFIPSVEEGEERNATVTVTLDTSRETAFIPFSFGSFEDADRLDDTVTVTIDEDNLPEGYTLTTPSVVTFNIIDDDGKIITFVGEDGRVEEDSGQTVSIELQVSPPLKPGETFVIPLKVTGDADAYTLTGATTGGGSPSTLKGAAPTVVFTGDTSTGPDSLTLTVTPPYNDDDLVFDVVNVEIDRDRLPSSFILGDKISWRVEIPDDQLHSVSWESDGIVGYEAEAGRIGDVALFVHPPLPPGMGLGFDMRVPGRDPWKRGTCKEGCTLVEVILEEVNTGGDAVKTRGFYHAGNPNRLWVYWITQHDKDPWSETIAMTITHAPHPLKIGEIPTYTLFINDDD